MRKSRSIMTEKLVKSLIMLIENSSLRERISSEASKSFESGEFSITNRNKIIKEIFESATNF